MYIYTHNVLRQETEIHVKLLSCIYTHKKYRERGVHRERRDEGGGTVHFEEDSFSWVERAHEGVLTSHSVALHQPAPRHGRPTVRTDRSRRAAHKRVQASSAQGRVSAVISEYVNILVERATQKKQSNT